MAVLHGNSAKYMEEVQHENQYTQEGFVYALGQRVALARNEHHDTGATPP
jgi:hypothetical protein